MNKQQFLDAIRDKIGVLPPQDRERSLDFYSEIIDDRMEDGLTEEQAVEAVGSVEEVSAQILSEAQLPSAEPARIPRKIRVWEIVLLILGAPLWISLLAAAAMLALSVVLVLLTAYAVLWTGVLVLYTGNLCLAVGVVAGIAGGVYFLTSGSVGPALLFFGAALVRAGLAIAAFFLCNLAAKGVFLLGKYVFLGVKALIVRKGAKK